MGALFAFWKSSANSLFLENGIDPNELKEN